jgi:aurora kinase, other
LYPDKKEPEENKHMQPYTEAVDVWAVGVLAYEMLSGRSPFAKEAKRDTFNSILKDEPQMLYTMSPDAQAFIKMCLVSTMRSKKGKRKTQ